MIFYCEQKTAYFSVQLASREKKSFFFDSSKSSQTTLFRGWYKSEGFGDFISNYLNLLPFI